MLRACVWCENICMCNISEEVKCVLCAKNASGVFWSIPNVLIFRADLLKVVYADDYY